MKKILLLSTLLISNVANAGLNLDYRAYNTPVNYNFAEIQLGYHVYKPDAQKDIDTTNISIGSELMLNEDVILKYSFSGEEINDATVLGANVGLLYRLPVTEKLDFILGGEVKLDWLGVDDIDGGSHYSHENTDIGAHLGVRYGFTDKLEGVTQVVISDTSSTSSMTTEVTSKLSYYVSKNVGVGAFYLASFNDYIDESNVGVHVRFRF